MDQSDPKISQPWLKVHKMQQILSQHQTAPAPKIPWKPLGVFGVAGC